MLGTDIVAVFQRGADAGVAQMTAQGGELLPATA